MSKHVPFIPNQYYHLYNRGNNRENLFKESWNYAYFLKLYAKHIHPVAETYAYCLLKNHFHELMRIRTDQERRELSDFGNLKALRPASQHFSNFFNAYAKAINKAYDRTGALFERPVKRILVTSNTHLLRLVIYLHHNPALHGFVDDFRAWKHSSYFPLLENDDTFLKREDVIDWFAGYAGFINARGLPREHQEIQQYFMD